jgi:uncharacterized protein YraI
MRRIFFITLLCFFCLTTQSLGQTVKVTSSRANLRSGPGIEHRVITKVTKGKSLDVVGKKGDWLKVRWKGGKEGWIHGKLVKVTSPSTIRVSVNRENLRKTSGGREEQRVRKSKGPGRKVKKDEVFVFRKIRLTESLGMVKVTGEMANHSGQDLLAAGFMISFFDVKQQLLGIGEILIDDFEKGETKPFTTYVEDVNYRRIHRYLIQFDFGI